MTKETDLIKDRFGVNLLPDKPPISRYNIAPTQFAAIITNALPTTIQYYRWGLISSFKPEHGLQQALINARQESVLEKPTFKQYCTTQRCLIPVDSYYEWVENMPYRIALASEELFAFAGIWSCWQQPDGTSIYSFCTLTTEATGVLAQLHHRMPVVLAPEAEAKWLQPGLLGAETIRSLLTRTMNATWNYYPVSPKLNDPRNDGPELWQSVPHHRQQSLF